MDKLYRFSPIKDKQTLYKAFSYLTVELEKLSQKLIDEKLPISILKVFAHYPEEYQYLYNLIVKKGPKAPFCSDMNLYVAVNEKINGHAIKYIGVRNIDPFRMQVGCGDYEVQDFAGYTKKYGNSQFIRPTTDSSDMLELWDPDFDVLGYIIEPL